MGYEPTDLFATLADPTRLRLLMLLMRAPSLCVCHLVEAMQEPQPKLSKHLGVLREMGLVSDERRAQWVHYSLKSDLPAWVRQVIEAAAQAADGQAPFKKDAARLAKRLAASCAKAA
jgi:ArsR family transcriptional regulator